MRYLWIVAMLLMITGCGGNSSDTDAPPVSPKTHDSGKRPPQVPVID